MGSVKLAVRRYAGSAAWSWECVREGEGEMGEG